MGNLGRFGTDPKKDIENYMAELNRKLKQAFKNINISQVILGLTTSKAVVTDASGNLAPSATTSTELGYLSGVTSAVQTQLGTKVPTSRTINSKALTTNITLDYSDVGAVPTSRTVNSKALTADITLSASDVGALPTSGGTSSGNITFDATKTIIIKSPDGTNFKIEVSNAGVLSASTI
jgi:hypothetical protein